MAKLRREITRFKELLNAPVATMPADMIVALTQPLRDLAVALSESGVGADVVADDQIGGRFTLVMWPQYRPATRTLALTCRMMDGRLITSDGAGDRDMRSADDVTKWLIHEVTQQRFREQLEYIRRQATGRIDGRLERANGMATLVRVSPEQQRLFAEWPIGATHELSIELQKGELVPDVDQLVSLFSEGFRFDVQNAAIVRERTVRAMFTKKSEGGARRRLCEGVSR